LKQVSLHPMSNRLPIYDVLDAIKEALVEQTVLILQAPPGAGKSTVLPLELLQENWLGDQKIILLEPRRIAARAVAARLAASLHEEVGETVGYRVRFETKVSKQTKIEIVTEGILTRMLQNDGALEGVGLVIFDEFHERSLHADLALALCRESQQILRPDLRMLIMSATLDGAGLASLLGQAPVVTSAGRQFPVTHTYLEQDEHMPLYKRMCLTIRKALAEQAGDILVFLPGTADIMRTQTALEEVVSGIRICPLYGDLSPHQQQQALQPDADGLRKVVLATSIAETSLTIEGITVVIDSGYARVPRFDARTGLTRLETIKVTQDAADQRAGRAGRLGPGHCYRMWAEGTNRYLNAHRKPEIVEADLAPLTLELARWGVTDPRTLTWLTPPPAQAIAQAHDLLTQLDAIDEKKITERGKKLLDLPTHPRIAHLLLEASELTDAKKRIRLTALSADVAALLEERDPLERQAGADLSLRVELLRKWRNHERVSVDRSRLERIERLSLAWRKMLRVDANNEMPVAEEIGWLIAAAYPDRIAKKESNRYRMANGRPAKLPEHDPLEQEAWIAVAQLDAGTNEGRIFLAASLDADDLLHLAKEREITTWDALAGELISRAELRVGELVIRASKPKEIAREKRMQLLTDVVRQEGLDLLNWNDDLHDLRTRIACIKKWRPEEDWPDLSDAYLLETLDEWLSPWLENVRRRSDFKKIDLAGIIRSRIDWNLQQQLEKLVPEKMEVPSGSFIRLQYSSDGAPPILAVRLQELFGLLDTPSVNEGKTKLMIHLLSPAYRLVQVTQDLRSFWQHTYTEVRKELRMRYPKHAWPEDPFTAQAVRGVKKKPN
jgi:ATP-dependent helicase HrpB